MTDNSVEKLTRLYKKCSERMDKVNFNLRSCNSNSFELKNEMIKDGRYVQHGCIEEKVLGYKYNPSLDTMHVSNISVDPKANSKRKVLTEFSKLFDPLGYTAPVAVRHKIFYSTLWAKPRTENHWDEEISVEQQIQWAGIAKDLERLSEVELPRCSFSQDEPVDLFLFSDASSKAYGFVAYAVQKETSNFVFCKPKVAPLQKRSLPQLELLGCLVSLQGLFNILEIFKHVNMVMSI